MLRGSKSLLIPKELTSKVYLSLASKHAVRMVVDRLQVVVHAAARRLEAALGPGITRHPRYREALIEEHRKKGQNLKGEGLFWISS